MEDPVPLRLTTVVGFVVDVLTIVSVPVALLATVGVNCTESVADWPAFNTRGSVAPETLKPVPATVTALTVTAEPPDEVSVSDWVAVVFRATVPNVKLDALIVSAAGAAFS